MEPICQEEKNSGIHINIAFRVTIKVQDDSSLKSTKRRKGVFHMQDSQRIMYKIRIGTDHDAISEIDFEKSAIQFVSIGGGNIK